ncbi:MAG: TRAP transporter small permease [Pseudomonadota bacterium]|uniref:TRAP transporter small permease n=1 Tax=Fodinicurvata fenggangensis TaxID=1121830 RepID=UPI0006904DB1|nr:TRAP transporter small permease [Fodinicurvata fenggangensis]
MQILVNAVHRLVQLMNILGAAAAVVMTTMVFAGAVMRYFFGAPLRFSDEMVGLLFVSMAFLAIPLGVFRNQHITIDILSRKIPRPWAYLANAIALVILMLFSFAFVWSSYQFMDFSREISSRSDIGSLLLWPWMAIMPTCMGVAFLVALMQFLDAFRVMAGRESYFPSEGYSTEEQPEGGHP